MSEEIVNKNSGEQFARRWYELTQECPAPDVIDKTCCTHMNDTCYDTKYLASKD